MEKLRLKVFFLVADTRSRGDYSVGRAVRLDSFDEKLGAS